MSKRISGSEGQAYGTIYYSDYQFQKEYANGFTLTSGIQIFQMY